MSGSQTRSGRVRAPVTVKKPRGSPSGLPAGRYQRRNGRMSQSGSAVSVTTMLTGVFLIGILALTPEGITGFLSRTLRHQPELVAAT